MCPNVWWFNGVSPQPKNYVTTLKASPSGGTDYSWTITDGTAYAQFSNNSSTIDTNGDNKVEILPSADPGAGTPPPVSVTVTVTSKEGTATSDPFDLGVRKPYRLQPTLGKCGAVMCDISDPYGRGYESMLYYRIQDQTMMDLPDEVLPLNEQFTTGLTNVYPGTNWVQPGNCGGGANPECRAFPPSGWFDRVTGAGAETPHPKVPMPQPPQSPLGTAAVDSWSGTWGIGDGHPGKGVTVQTNDWMRFQDHARHTNIVSPSP
ncbi:MAG: hypothetical protein ACREDT_02220 [Methylocella sp.]